MMAAAASVLAPWIERYLALKIALGCRGDGERYILLRLDRYLAEHGGDLTAYRFAHWCQQLRYLKSGVRRAHMRIVRNLCLYRQRFEPACFVPDHDAFPALHQPVRPHIFTDAEIIRLLQAAATLAPGQRSPLRAEAFHLAIILLYTTGLRRQELVRLTLGDYDARTQTLLVRASKFHKSRELPLSLSTAQALEGYLEHCQQQQLPMSDTTALISHHQGQPYCGGGFAHTLRALFQQAAIRTVDGRYPRVHDTRHSFAVNALWRWYRQGQDVQAKLPFLALYMGHVSIVSTAYYLPFIEPLAGQASARFEGRYGTLIRPLNAANEEAR